MSTGQNPVTANNANAVMRESTPDQTSTFDRSCSRSAIAPTTGAARMRTIIGMARIMPISNSLNVSVSSQTGK